MNLVENKITIVTGAARGIGAAAAFRLAEAGAGGMVIADIDEDRARETAEKIRKDTDCTCMAIKTNVALEEDVDNCIRKAVGKYGAIDILVNSAGICRIMNMDDITVEQWERTMDINLKGTFLFSRAALRIMKEKRSGKIINIASQAGKIGGLIVGPDYSVSKAGVLCLTKSLAKSAAPFGITVNSVAPGLINTEMTKDFGYDSSTIPLGRIGTPEEVADVILFLASDLSRYMTGACIDVNGGMTMW